MYFIAGLIIFMNVIKDLSWELEPRKIKKMSSMKYIKKYIRWREVKIIMCSSLSMNRLAEGEQSEFQWRCQGFGV